MRILFVASIFDIQTVFWLRQLENTGWDIHVFDRENLVHPELDGIQVHTGWAKTQVPDNTVVHSRWPFTFGRHFTERQLPRLWNRIVPPAGQMLAETIRKVKPDLIHVLGSNPYGYWWLDALEFMDIESIREFPIPWIYSSKGSDIYFWGSDSEHKQKIQKLVQGCPYYICNCERDVRMARDYGFDGQLLGLFQGMGGHPVEKMQAMRQPGLVSRRRVVAVKGLQHHVGRALTALESLRMCADVLQGYTIKIFQAHPETVQAAERFSKEEKITVEIIARSSAWRIFELFGESRLALGVSVSDGVPNAMIEAMIMGAFPVQTDPGGATAEWVRDGENGLLIPFDNPGVIATAVRRALRDDALVDSAARDNLSLALSRIDDLVIQPQIVALYERVVRGR